ncbi:MAG: anthranilate synthase component I family protein [Alphaproteobacteria bacterium]|nr:anthranilate synthase component I family protein [Alphaproteobacteria bacterium]
MRVTSLPYCDPVRALYAFRDDPMCILLHGCGDQPSARWSYLLPRAVEHLVSRGPGEAVLERLRAWRGRSSVDGIGSPFSGGAAGFLGYEFGARLDPAMPQRGGGRLPEAAIGLYDHVIAFDNTTRRAFSLSRDAPPDPDVLNAIAVAAEAPDWTCATGSGRVSPIDTRSSHASRVRVLLERIAAGDFYQANISRLYAGELGAGDHPYDLFARLCALSPAPFCAYMRLPGAAIVSNSPERFVSLRLEGQALRATTAPIKGTRPRGHDAAADARLIADLVGSEKERAENLMIVDLMRNDLSRISQAGTVRAPTLFSVESYSNVHHLVSCVESLLKPDAGACELLRAAFPAGSITGAPKLKAMQWIDALEGGPREANYGSIAWFGADGAMDANVLIRTATCFERGAGWDVEFRVGGGITIDSDPDAEVDETEAKALNLIRAIEGDDR